MRDGRGIESEWLIGLVVSIFMPRQSAASGRLFSFVGGFKQIYTPLHIILYLCMDAHSAAITKHGDPHRTAPIELISRTGEAEL